MDKTIDFDEKIKEFASMQESLVDKKIYDQFANQQALQQQALYQQTIQQQAIQQQAIQQALQQQVLHQGLYFQNKYEEPIQNTQQIESNFPTSQYSQTYVLSPKISGEIRRFPHPPGKKYYYYPAHELVKNMVIYKSFEPRQWFEVVHFINHFGEKVTKLISKTENIEFWVASTPANFNRWIAQNNVSIM